MVSPNQRRKNFKKGKPLAPSEKPGRKRIEVATRTKLEAPRKKELGFFQKMWDLVSRSNQRKDISHYLGLAIKGNLQVNTQAIAEAQELCYGQNGLEECARHEEPERLKWPKPRLARLG